MTTTVRDVIRSKGDAVETVVPHVSVRSAVDRMNACRIGSVVVVDGERVAGIFTERDVLRRLVAASRDPEATQVWEVMSRDLSSVRLSDDIYDVLRRMTRERKRHMPVLESGRLVGMVSIGDLTDCALREMDGEVTDLARYIHGPASHPSEGERPWGFSRART